MSFYLTKPGMGASTALTPEEQRLREYPTSPQKGASGISNFADGISMEEVLKEIGLNHPEKTQKKAEPGQVGDFMRLFIEQLKNQNPLEPQEGSEFLGQLAQFNTVERLVNVEQAISKMANAFQSSRILEATGLIGKSVQVPTNKMNLKSDKLDGGKLEGALIGGKVYLPDIGADRDPETQAIVSRKFTEVRIEIMDAKTGTNVLEVAIDPAAVTQKEVDFSWNGADFMWDGKVVAWDGKVKGERLKDVNGDPIQDGEYLLKIRTLDGDNEQYAQTDISTLVDSVSIAPDTGAISLSASSVGTIGLSEVTTIYDGQKQ